MLLCRRPIKRASKRQQAAICWVLPLITVVSLALLRFSHHGQRVVLLLPPKPLQQLAFVHYGPLQSWQAVSLLHARLSNPNATTNLLLQTPQPLGHKIVKLGKVWGVRTFIPSYNTKYSAAAQRLRAVYRHSSANEFEYEFKAFERYLVIQDFVAASGIESVLMLDLDVFVFDNLFALLPPDTTITRYATFATHWSSRSLDAFVDFMFAFYSRNTSAVVADLLTFGDKGFMDAVNRNVNISSWWPDGVERTHFSDMYMLKAFIALHPEMMHTICNGPHECKEELAPLLNVRIAGPHTCDNSSSLLTAYDWKPSSIRGWPLHPHLRTTGRSVPGVHFQGTCKRLAAELLCSNVAAEYGNCNA